MRVRLALTLGDPAGIGPEIVRSVVARLEGAPFDLCVIGPEAFLPAGLPRIALEELDGTPGDVALVTPDPGAVHPGRVQPSGGRAALDALRLGHELSLAGRVDALVTAPVSKEALHLAGERCEGQTELLGRWSGCRRFQMTVVVDGLQVMVLTRHLPLADALREIRTELVVEHLELLHETLSRSGLAAPRIGLAGLNPHAGERGLLGSEELRVLAPAVEAVRARGFDVSDPVSPDALFLDAFERFDGVLCLYHDQAFIPLKLLGRDRGVTVLAGLPYPRVSPIHGTAFDLVGTGRASDVNLERALFEAARLAPGWRIHDAERNERGARA